MNDDIIVLMRRKILDYFPPASCVTSTKIACKVFEQLGLKAEPLPVIVKIIHPQGTHWLGQRNVKPSRLDHKWYGHVGVVLDRKMFIDISLDQVKKFNLDLDPISFDINDDFINGLAWPEIVIGDYQLTYYPQPGNTGFELRRYWKKPNRKMRRCIKEILEAVTIVV